MQTWVRVSEVLASPEMDIDRALEAHAAVVAGLERLIERNTRSRPRFGAGDGLTELLHWAKHDRCGWRHATPGECGSCWLTCAGRGPPRQENRPSPMAGHINSIIPMRSG